MTDSVKSWVTTLRLVQPTAFRTPISRARLGDVAGHRLEGDQNGHDDGDQGSGQGKFIRQGKEAAQELQERVRGGDGGLFPQNVFQGSCQRGNLFLVRLDEEQVHISRLEGGNGLELFGG